MFFVAYKAFRWWKRKGERWAIQFNLEGDDVRFMTFPTRGERDAYWNLHIENSLMMRLHREASYEGW